MARRVTKQCQRWSRDCELLDGTHDMLIVVLVMF